jgi:hypothetical protein
VGQRDQARAKGRLQRLPAVSCGAIPCFPRNQWPHSTQALWPGEGIPEVILHIPGKRGPKPPPKRLPLTDLWYAQVIKPRQGGRVVQGTTTIIFGSAEAVQAR